jgi:hypothetical protein
MVMQQFSICSTDVRFRNIQFFQPDALCFTAVCQVLKYNVYKGVKMSAKKFRDNQF